MCAPHSGRFFKPKNKYYAHYIDKSRVEAAKHAAKIRVADFVSTNDILTSTFEFLSNARLCFVAMNLRNCEKGATDSDAWNYKCLLMVDTDVYKHPEGI